MQPSGRFRSTEKTVLRLFGDHLNGLEEGAARVLQLVLSRPEVANDPHDENAGPVGRPALERGEVWVRKQVAESLLRPLPISPQGSK